MGSTSVRIPHCLNYSADFLSKFRITTFSRKINFTILLYRFLDIFGILTVKHPQFNSISYFVGTGGVDAVYCSWNHGDRIGFSTDMLIILAVLHLEMEMMRPTYDTTIKNTACAHF
jgi:hypothetical protein